LRQWLMVCGRMALSKMTVMSKTPGMMDDFRPIMPSLIRLLAGVIVLIVAQSVVLGFPGIAQSIPSTTMTMATVASLSIGLVATVVVLKFGTQLANAVGAGYRSMKNYAPLLGYFFQIAALWILYSATRAVTADFFTSAPWAYPLIFLALAIMPTVRVVVSLVHALEGTNERKQSISRQQF